MSRVTVGVLPLRTLTTQYPRVPSAGQHFVTTPYQWKILEWDKKKLTKTNFFFVLLATYVPTPKKRRVNAMSQNSSVNFRDIFMYQRCILQDQLRFQITIQN